jgi:hypothetical protein
MTTQEQARLDAQWRKGYDFAVREMNEELAVVSAVLDGIKHRLPMPYASQMTIDVVIDHIPF